MQCSAVHYNAISIISLLRCYNLISEKLLGKGKWFFGAFAQFINKIALLGKGSLVSRDRISFSSRFVFLK